MRYLSLFSGIGGFELGIKQAYESNNEHAPLGEESKQEKCTQRGERSVDKHGVLLHTGDGSAPLCIGFSEIDKYATEIYQKHFPNHKNHGDITKINEKELPDFDLLVGGFPCQSFSIAGKRGGFEDTRGTMFFEIARIVREKQPRLLLLENVKGLLSHDKGQTFRTIISTLDELGYDIQWQVLNSKNHGVPQNRERVFIIGHLRGTSRPEVFPFGGSEQETSNKETESVQANCLTATCHKGAGNDGMSLIVKGTLETDGWEKRNESTRRVYSPNGVAPTIPTAQGGGVMAKIVATQVGSSENFGNSHGSDIAYTLRSGNCGGVTDYQSIRRLTPTECERLQGFPAGWTENGLSDTMEICVNINPAIEKQLLQSDTVSNITNDGSGMVIPISQNKNKESVNIVLHELLLEDGAINTISRGNAMATLFNRKETLLNATQLKESLTLEKMVEKSTCKLWKVNLVGHYKKEKLSTILTWINETMQSITSISARIDENIIGVIILLNSQEQNYSNGELLCLKTGNIESISDTQRYKTLGNAVTVNVIRDIMERLL